jgi:release factor glutamine methyltransferase
MGGLDAGVVGWEPTTALQGGRSGLEAIEDLVTAAPAWLAPHGVMVLEIAPHQADPATRMAQAAGFRSVDVHPDLAGRDRALVARR